MSGVITTIRNMKFAILAAGEGSRLANEGIHVPKPLVPINGEAMIDRLIRIFKDNEADDITIITNNIVPQTQQHIKKLQADGNPIRLIVKTTPSSMHSFYELYPYLGTGKFCLTTVDTIFHELEFFNYIKAFEQSNEDGLMAVSDFIDDEKPLYVATDDDMNITGFYDTKREDTRFVSGGIYCLDSKAFATLRSCINKGMSRMRNFQRQMVSDGLRLKAYRFSKILDVDHVSDIKKAEDFLK